MRIGLRVQHDGENDCSYLLETCSFLAVGTCASILEMLRYAQEVEAVPTGKRADLRGEFLQTDGAGGYFI